ncbi:hypothetical protein [Arthrobacter sp. NicSoilC12]|uniref:hypothetical protein n=1 Tax=Arthrobacter sp. NicSoilC12 TaxID=2831001 RepID=UPI001CC34783|nr:hypothetical protein [Arthrobacter sp. NicSoilC12]GIU55479.1 hypothetical protein NicSoilC12_12280 [Arthrobacter sp. NicSoilC12]
MPNRYRLKGASLEEIRRKAEQLYGPAARIVSAERVSSPGIAGLFAQDRYEAMIELQSKHEVVTGEVVPDADILAGADSGPATGGPAGETAAGAASAGTVPGTVPGAGTPAGKYDAGAVAAASAPPAARTAAQAGPAGGPARPTAPTHHLQGAAIAALLEEADAAELSLHRPAPAGVSTESRDFAELLEQLGTGLRTPTDPPAAAPTAAAVGSPVHPAAVEPGIAAGAPAPAPLTGVGDLVLLIGLGEDAMDTALAMSMASGGADVRTAGELSAYGHLHVDGRQSATAARAHAVVTERTVLVAFGLGKARNALARVPSVAALSADQVWVVVDAGRKHEDTARWVGVLSAQLNVTAVAVVGASETGSPESVNGLGLPVGWIDGRPSGPELTWQNRRESYDAPRTEG